MVKTVVIMNGMACIGGTLLVKCIASLPKTVILSEISPSGIAAQRFSPLDPLEVATASYPELFDLVASERVGRFAERLAPILDRVDEWDLTLVIRNHSHSEFMTARPPQELMSSVFEVLGRDFFSFYLVRHPVASYLSARANGFIRMVGTFDEYCQRYNMFLDNSKGAKIFKYEDFIRSPYRELRDICESVHLRYDSMVFERFSRRWFSGNSGRLRNEASVRPIQARPINNAARDVIESSAPYLILCERLGYPTSYLEYKNESDKAYFSFDPNIGGQA